MWKGGGSRKASRLWNPSSSTIWMGFMSSAIRLAILSVIDHNSVHAWDVNIDVRVTCFSLPFSVLLACLFSYFNGCCPCRWLLRLLVPPWYAKTFEQSLHSAFFPSAHLSKYFHTSDLPLLSPPKRPLPCSPLAITHCAAAGMCERSHIPAAAPRWRTVYEFVRTPRVYYRLF